MARREKLVQDIPTILAPCGELSPGALRSKPFKKKVYLAFAKFRGLYSEMIWKASTEAEVNEIRNVFGGSLTPLIAPDLTPISILPDFRLDQKPEKIMGSVKFIFLSRIVPKKNIKFFLELLTEIRHGNIELEIVGPQEDNMYWQECLAVIEKLPGNVKVKCIGGVSYENGLKTLCNSHFFVLPTLNENFGYVFIESLAAGTPLLISDQTVWGKVEQNNAGWAIQLDDKERWLTIINSCIAMDQEKYGTMSKAARDHAIAWLADTTLERATATVLEAALDKHKLNDR